MLEAAAAAAVILVAVVEILVVAKVVIVVVEAMSGYPGHLKLSTTVKWYGIKDYCTDHCQQCSPQTSICSKISEIQLKIKEY